MSDTYETIRQAIFDKHQVIAAYNGHVREIQFGGTSSSDLPPGGEWRCIPIEGLQDVVSRAGEWHTVPNHSQPQTCVDVIDVEVAH